MKVDEKITQFQEKNSFEIPSFSYEYFVPKTLQGSYNLYERIDKMHKDSNPLFVDITWNAGGIINPSSSQKKQEISKFSGKLIPKTPQTNDIIDTTQQALNLDSCMHMTCTNMTIKEIDTALKKAYNSGCQNILALRGDPPRETKSESESPDGNSTEKVKKYPFKYAIDLIKYIKEKYGDHFCIGVAAYPEGHPEEKNADKLIDYLKQKVDLGATFIITQMFYNSDLFIEWCKKLRAAGIPESVHIIPGIMPITSYDSFLRRCNWCQIDVPAELNNILKPVSQDDEALRNLATNYLAKMCLKLFRSGYVKHLHFYTMNLEKGSFVILRELERLLGKRLLPLTSGIISNPNKENEIQPIFWRSRPFTYIERKKKSQKQSFKRQSSFNDPENKSVTPAPTSSASGSSSSSEFSDIENEDIDDVNNEHNFDSELIDDEFPNGRFGDSSSPAFGNLDLSLTQLIRQSESKSLSVWGTPTSLKDLGDLIINYLKGDLRSLPWCDTSVALEAKQLLRLLISLNQGGILTVNSQPKANGVPSSDPILGWGPSLGYVYQKQYIEFLLPKRKLKDFLLLMNQKTTTTFTYLISDSQDEIFIYKGDDGQSRVMASDVTKKADIEKSSVLQKYNDLLPDICKKMYCQCFHGCTKPTAVTWGCFPGREIVTSTIVEKNSFLMWRDELFAIIKEWKNNFVSISKNPVSIKKEKSAKGNAKNKHSESENEPAAKKQAVSEDDLSEKSSKAADVLDSVLDDYLLVSLVDNDYVSPGDLLLFTLLQLAD
ncbi:unnamed protein product [Hanseniaspora opuntiae]